jgi:hypothetical protein
LGSNAQSTELLNEIVEILSKSLDITNKPKNYYFYTYLNIAAIYKKLDNYKLEFKNAKIFFSLCPKDTTYINSYYAHYLVNLFIYEGPIVSADDFLVLFND